MDGIQRQTNIRMEHEQLKLQLRDASLVVRAVLGVDPTSSAKLDGHASIKAVRKYAAMKRLLKRLRTNLATTPRRTQIRERDTSFDSTATPIKVAADEEMDTPVVVSPAQDDDDETSRRLSFPSTPAIGLMVIRLMAIEQQQQQNSSSSPTTSSSESSRSVKSSASGSSVSSSDAREISMRQETLKSQNEQIQVLNELVQARQERIQRLQTELGEAKEQEVESLREAVEQHGKLVGPPEHEDRIKELEAENRKNIARMSILTEQLNKSSEAVEMLMGELGQVREEEERSKLELDNLRAHLEEARLKVSDASKELETIRSGTEDRSAEVEDLTKQLQDALSEIAKLSQEVETKRAHERSRAKERNDLMGQLVITRAVQDSLTNAVAEARTKERASTHEMIELMSTGSVDISRGGETSDEEDNKSLSAEDANGGDGNDTRLMRDELLELRTRLEEAQMNVEELEQERNYNLAKVSELNKLLDITKADDTTKELHAKAMECAKLNAEVDKLTSDLQDCNGKIEKLEVEREVYKAKVEELSSVWDTHTKAIEAEKHLRENLQKVEKQLSASRERSQQLQRERDLTMEKAASLSIRVAESRAKIDDLTEQLEYERKFSAGQAIGRRSKHGLGSSIHSTVSALSMHSASEMKPIEPLGEEESTISEGAASGRKSASIFLPFVRGRKQTSNTVLDEKARIRELKVIVARQENTIVKLRSKSGSSDDDDDLVDEEVEVIDIQPSRSSQDADAAAGSILSSKSGMTKEQAQELTIQRLMKQVEESDINATEPASVSELLAKIMKLEEDNAEYSIKVESLQSTLEEVAHENVARSIKIMKLEQEYKEGKKQQQQQ